MYWNSIVEAWMVTWMPSRRRALLGVLDYVDSTLAVAERYRPPPVIVRTLVHEGLSMLDDFAREYRGYVGRVMLHVCMELRSILYETFEECEGFRGER
ncbi:MAG: hypothetical protein LZ166_04730 [Thaumarchaeota archaeon]|nr:hypothetical protein [Candidatus Wolframiiraptor allenii]